MVDGKDKKLREREKELSRVNRKLFSAITRKNFRKNKDFGKEVTFPDHSWSIQRELQKEKVFKGEVPGRFFFEEKIPECSWVRIKRFPMSLLEITFEMVQDGGLIFSRSLAGRFPPGKNLFSFLHKKKKEILYLPLFLLLSWIPGSCCPLYGSKVP